MEPGKPPHGLVQVYTVVFCNRDQEQQSTDIEKERRIDKRLDELLAAIKEAPEGTWSKLGPVFSEWEDHLQR